MKQTKHVPGQSFADDQTHKKFEKLARIVSLLTFYCGSRFYEEQLKVKSDLCRCARDRMIAFPPSGDMLEYVE